MRDRRELKAKTLSLMTDLMKSLVSEEEADSITKDTVMSQLGKRTYYRDHATGSIKLGLCYKQIRKEVKKNPQVTVAEIKKKHKLE